MASGKGSCNLSAHRQKELSFCYSGVYQTKESIVDWRRGGPIMKVASIADVKARLSAYVKASRRGPIVVTRNGKAVAVLLAVADDDELERLLLAHSPKFQAILQKSRRQIEETGGIPHDEFWRQVDAENRQARASGINGRRVRTRR
jgi:prevent-host-death family protein